MAPMTAEATEFGNAIRDRTDGDREKLHRVARAFVKEGSATLDNIVDALLAEDGETIARILARTCSSDGLEALDRVLLSDTVTTP